MGRNTNRRAPETLEELFRQFNEDAKRIDPTITGSWVMTDETQAHRGLMAAIYFEREGSPMVRASDQIAA